MGPEREYMDDVLSSLFDTKKYEHMNINVNALYIVKVLNIGEEELELLRLHIASGGEYHFFYEMYKDEADIMHWRAEILMSRIADVVYHVLPELNFPISLVPTSTEGLLVYMVEPQGDSKAIIVLQHYTMEEIDVYRNTKFGQ